MRPDGSLPILAYPGQSHLVLMVQMAVTSFALRSVLVCTMNYVVTIDEGLEVQYPLCLPCLPRPHQMLIQCIETFSFHQPLISQETYNQS